MSKMYFAAELDDETGSIYVYINSEATVHHTVEVNGKINVDVDSQGDPVGLEWL